MNKIEIRPFIGIGKSILGYSEDDIKNVLGDPTSINDEYYGQEEIEQNLNRIYVYENHMLDLTFSAEYKFKLSTITAHSPDSELFGFKLIGMEEETFLKIAGGLGYGVPEIGDDWEEYRDYFLDSIGLSFWISDGIVENITIYPEYDESGNTIIWPSEKNR